MESIVVCNKIQLRIRIPMVNPIFHARVVCGRHQIRGNARGPTEQTAMTMKDFRKYHGIFFSAKFKGFDPSRNSPQCLHFIAASWISSAQKGHFFIIISLGRTVKIPNQYFRKCNVNITYCVFIVNKLSDLKTDDICWFPEVMLHIFRNCISDDNRKESLWYTVQRHFIIRLPQHTSISRRNCKSL